MGQESSLTLQQQHERTPWWAHNAASPSYEENTGLVDIFDLLSVPSNKPMIFEAQLTQTIYNRLVKPNWFRPSRSAGRFFSVKTEYHHNCHHSSGWFKLHLFAALAYNGSQVAPAPEKANEIHPVSSLKLCLLGYEIYWNDDFACCITTATSVCGTFRNIGWLLAEVVCAKRSRVTNWCFQRKLAAE